MKPTTLLLVIALSVISVQTVLSQSSSSSTFYVIRVESEDSSTQSINFTAAYTVYDSPAGSKMQYIEQTTPFEAKVFGDYFLGMFQSSAAPLRLKVSLLKVENDGSSFATMGSGVFNFVHGEPKSIGYGIPVPFANTQIDKR